MRIQLVIAAAMTLMLCGTLAAQDCGCTHYSGHGHFLHKSVCCCHRAWTYDQAAALWAGYCTEQCGNGCCLGGGHGRAVCCGNRGCGFGWPAGCCGNGCRTGCGINFGLKNRGGCDSGGSRFGGFAWPGGCCDSGCCDAGSCDSHCGAGCCGPRHGCDLFAGLKSRNCCDAGCDAGCDMGVKQPGVK